MRGVKALRQHVDAAHALQSLCLEVGYDPISIMPLGFAGYARGLYSLSGQLGADTMAMFKIDAKEDSRFSSSLLNIFERTSNSARYKISLVDGFGQ
jgi:hypothetical protein